MSEVPVITIDSLADVLQVETTAIGPSFYHGFEERNVRITILPLGLVLEGKVNCALDARTLDAPWAYAAIRKAIIDIGWKVSESAELSREIERRLAPEEQAPPAESREITRQSQSSKMAL